MRKFALLGERLDYSFSQGFFTDFFSKKGIEAVYKNIELKHLAAFLQSDVRMNYQGFNVTIPFKVAICEFLDELSPEAQAIGAVNTVKLERGRMIGYNTDAFGFGQSIKPFLTNRHERALVLGTGGASKAVIYVLESLGVDVLQVSRTPVGPKQFAYDDINSHMINACKLIVNCTPIGTFPSIEEKPACPTQFFSAEHLVVDLIYNPLETRFLREAKQSGATILNGYSMLQEQALKSWEIWNS